MRLVSDLLGLREQWDAQGNIPEGCRGCWAGAPEEAKSGDVIV